jgi:hypothetical protein
MGKPSVVSCQSLEARVLKVLRRMIVGTAEARPETAIGFHAANVSVFLPRATEWRSKRPVFRLILQAKRVESASVHVPIVTLFSSAVL